MAQQKRDRQGNQMNSPQRFAMRTGYHYWTIVDTHKYDETVQHFGARGQGDRAARLAARAFCTGANDGYMGAPYEDLAQPLTDDYMAGWSYGHEKRMP